MLRSALEIREKMAEKTRQPLNIRTWVSGGRWETRCEVEEFCGRLRTIILIVNCNINLNIVKIEYEYWMGNVI